MESPSNIPLAPLDCVASTCFATHPAKSSPILQTFHTKNLLRMILDHFKNESDAGDRSNILRDLVASAELKGRLVSLVTVNRAFFQGVIEILWEDMDSIQPFFSILESSSLKVDSNSDGIKQAWTRFRLYSAHTTALRLETDNSAALPLCAAQAPLIPSPPLFPSLKRFSTCSAKAVSFVRAFAPFPALRHIHLNFDDRASLDTVSSASVIIASLARDSKQLCSVCIARPVNPADIQSLSTTHALRHLTLHVRTGGAAQLLPLTELPLVSLEIDLAPSEHDARQSPAVASHTTRSRPIHNMLPTLQKLVVTADGGGHVVVADIFCVTNLTDLKLAVRYYNDSIESSHIVPSVLAVHLGRNPTLVSLTVRGIMREHRGDHSEARFVAYSESHYLAHLKRMKLLERIDITGVYLPTPDFLMQIVKMVPPFEYLRLFRFTPRHPTTSSQAWSVPTFDDLRAISYETSESVLTTLSMPIAVVPFPGVPAEFSSHRLQHLALYIYPQPRGTMCHKVLREVTLYLHRLFPSLVSLTSEFEECSEQWAVWKPVEEWMAVCQHIRAKSVADMKVHCEFKGL